MTDTPLPALIEAFALPTLAIDPDERIVAANAGATRLLGQGTVGRHFITSLRQPAVVDAVELCLGDEAARQATYLAGDNVTYDVHLHRAGSALIVSFFDVTQMTRAEQMRSDFVANVSHELRTPLTSLMGFIETLRGPARDDAAARDRFLSIMSTEAERMNRLVGDLLSLSRVEAQERVRPSTQVDLCHVVRTTVRNISVLTDDVKARITFSPIDQPLDIAGDFDQLQQVFTNLIENAIKYGGDRPRIDVTAQRHDHDATLRGPAIRISVTDHGPGIDPQHLPRLTERFYRIDSHRSRAMGGTGLGLAIVKHIVNRHRGQLKVTSDPGKGATFTVIVPQYLDA